MTAPSTISPKNFAIGVLSVTAVILLATLLTINAFVPRQAYAQLQAQAGASGNLLVTASRLDETAELLMVLDARQRLMNAYGFNVQEGRIVLIQQLDLDRLTKDVQRLQKGQGNEPAIRGGARPRR